MILSDPIHMRIQAFGDAAFSLLHEQYENRTPIKIGEKEFIAVNVDRKFSGQATTDCGSNIQEFFRVQMPWNGEGLPPVGVMCEYRLKPSNQWHKCEIRYHMTPSNFGELRAIVWNPDLKFDQISNSSWEFRPIRTPEQIAAVERQAAIKEMIGHIGGSRRCEAEVLYDAGYRKFEIVDN